MRRLDRRIVLAGLAASVATGAVATASSDILARHAATNGAALLLLRGGETVASVGDVARKLPAYSVRKSLLSALYGEAVETGRIRLDTSLAALGIDDEPPALTEMERSATVADLLAARSGVYHQAAYETREMAARRPARGAHAPGTFWFYNNWDFNALGTIYERATGQGVFAAFAEQIARPLDLRDFTRSDGAYVRAAVSRHPAYTFRLTTRDLAGFGEMMRLRGQWRGRRIVSEDWIARSTRAISPTDRPGLGYGYMWWTLPSDLAGGGFLASGNGGQLLAVLPSAGLVLAQMRRRDETSGHTRRFLTLLRTVTA